MEEPPELQRNRHWRMAVWTLRGGYVGLAVGLAGLILTLAGHTPWILFAGVVVWIIAAVATLTEFFLARHELSDPRPGYWSMRLMLIHDTVHARPSA